MKYHLAVGLVLALAPVFADAPPSGAPVLMDLNVVAVDQHGEPITDLTGDDFSITDAGKPQKIVYFHHVVAPPRQPPALAPGEFSNRRATSARHATVILFDLMNERFGTRGNAANEIVRYLGRLNDPGNLYLYFLTLDGRLTPVRGLPGAEDRASSPGDAPWTSRIKPIMDQAMRATAQLRPVDVDVAIRVQLTYRALSTLAGELSRIPGRKNVVWITDGVPMELGPRRSDTGDYVDFTPMLRQLSEVLHLAGVTIYPVRQIMLGSTDAPPDGSSGPGGGSDGMESVATLNEFARMTGGRPDGGKDIGAAVKQAMSDARTSYQIAYYPPERSWDGKFHKIRVVCNRRNVRIQAREGYYAWPRVPEEEARQAVQWAEGVAFDAGEIGLRGSLSPDPQDSHASKFEAHVDAQDITMPSADAGGYAGSLWLSVASYTADGRISTSAIMPLNLHYTAADRDKALADGIGFAQSIKLGDEAKTLRFVVFDSGSGAIGSLTIPVGQPGQQHPPGN